jgi:hypothetical protein
MNIYYSLSNIDHNKIYFNKPIVNKFSNYNLFYKINYNIYSFTLNSVLIMLTEINEKVIEELQQFELSVLNKLNGFIKKELCISNFKTIYKYKSERVYIRISGIWESDTHIGLTTKFDVLSVNRKAVQNNL